VGGRAGAGAGAGAFILREVKKMGKTQMKEDWFGNNERDQSVEKSVVEMIGDSADTESGQMTF